MSYNICFNDKFYLGQYILHKTSKSISVFLSYCSTLEAPYPWYVFFLSAVFQLLKRKVEKTHEKHLFHSSHIYFRMEKIEFLDFYMNGRNFYWKILHKILLLPIIFIEDDLILLFSLQLLLYFLILNNRLFILFSKSK